MTSKSTPASGDSSLSSMFRRKGKEPAEKPVGARDEKEEQQHLIDYWAKLGFDRARLKQLSVDIANAAIEGAIHLVEMEKIRKVGMAGIISSINMESSSESALEEMAIADGGRLYNIDVAAEEAAWRKEIKGLAIPYSPPEPVTRKKFHFGRRASSLDGGTQGISFEAASVVVVFICRLKRLRAETVAMTEQLRSAANGLQPLVPEVYAMWLEPYLINCYNGQCSEMEGVNHERLALIRAIR